MIRFGQPPQAPCPPPCGPRPTFTREDVDCDLPGTSVICDAFSTFPPGPPWVPFTLGPGSTVGPGGPSQVRTTVPAPMNNPRIAELTTPLFFNPAAQPFCFCVRGGLVSPVAEPSDNSLSIWHAGLGDVLTASAGFAVFIIAGPVEGFPTQTYKLAIVNGAVTVVEGIPVNGALHEFRVCRAADDSWTFEIDRVPFAVPVTAPPNILLNAAFGVTADGPDAPGADGLVDSYCLRI